MNAPAEAAAASVASKAAWGGGGTAFLAGMTSHDVIAWAGLLVGILGAITNWWFKRRADQRAERLALLREEYIRRGRRTDTDLAPLGADD